MKPNMGYKLFTFLLMLLWEANKYEFMKITLNTKHERGKFVKVLTNLERVARFFNVRYRVNININIENQHFHECKP